MNTSARRLSPTARNYPKLMLFALMGLMALLVFGYEVYFSIYDPTGHSIAGDKIIRFASTYPGLCLQNPGW